MYSWYYVNNSILIKASVSCTVVGIYTYFQLFEIYFIMVSKSLLFQSIKRYCCNVLVYSC